MVAAVKGLVVQRRIQGKHEKERIGGGGGLITGRYGCIYREYGIIGVVGGQLVN